MFKKEMSENQTIGLIIRYSLISPWEEAAYKKASALILKPTKDSTAWCRQPVDLQILGVLPDAESSPHSLFLEGASGSGLLDLRNCHAHSPSRNTKCNAALPWNSGMNCPLLVNLSVPLSYLVPTIKYLSPAINTERDFSRIHSSGCLVNLLVNPGNWTTRSAEEESWRWEHGDWEQRSGVTLAHGSRLRPHCTPWMDICAASSFNL